MIKSYKQTIYGDIDKKTGKQKASQPTTDQKWHGEITGVIIPEPAEIAACSNDDGSINPEQFGAFWMKYAKQVNALKKAGKVNVINAVDDKGKETRADVVALSPTGYANRDLDAALIIDYFTRGSQIRVDAQATAAIKDAWAVTESGAPKAGKKATAIRS